MDTIRDGHALDDSAGDEHIRDGEKGGDGAAERASGITDGCARDGRISGHGKTRSMPLHVAAAETQREDSEAVIVRPDHK